MFIARRLTACPPVCLQTDDLARMYRLFQRVPKGLEPVSEIFREHVEGEGNRLVKDVTEAMEDKRGKVGRLYLGLAACQYTRNWHNTVYCIMQATLCSYMQRKKT